MKNEGICPVCDECYMTATSFEIIARMYYLRMMELFAHEPEAADLFKEMAQDEAEHARVLEDIRNHRDHSQRIHDNAVVFSRTLLRLVTQAGESLTKEPKNLQDVFDFACQLEGSEVNEIYLKLTSEGHLPSDSSHPIVKQVNDHIRRLRTFGDRMSLAQREQVLPRTN